MAVLAKREKGSIISWGIKVKLHICLQWVIKVYKYDIEMFFFLILSMNEKKTKMY